jgi:hypothetical protein
VKPLRNCLLYWALLFASSLFAYSEQGIRIKVQAGAGIPTEDYLDTHIVSGLGFSISLEKRLSLSFDLGYWKSTIEQVPAKFYDGRLKAFPLLASLQLFLLRQNTVNPYVFLGCGHIFSSFAMQDIVTIPEITIDQDIKSGPIFQGGFGIDVHISRTLGVFAEAGSFRRKTTGVTTITDLNSGTMTQEFPINLNAWIFQIGIKCLIE